MTAKPLCTVCETGEQLVNYCKEVEERNKRE